LIGICLFYFLLSILKHLHLNILLTFFRTAVSIANIATTSSFTASKDDSCCQNDQQSQSSEPSIDNNYRSHNNQDHNQFHFPFSNLLPNIWPGHDRNFKEQESVSKFSRFV
jgi:hypothetical protein